MKLKKLLKNIEVDAVKGSKDVEITGICSNSTLVVPGNLFVAKKGLKTDGGRYIANAVAAGAVAIATDIYDPFLHEVVQIIHPDILSLEAELASRFYEQADKKLFSVAFTGTNGKTTGTFLTKHLLDGLKAPCGVIGTIEWILGKQTMLSTHTTPDVLMNYKLFHEMVQNGCKAVAMEVSSHALQQGRVRGILFDVGVFTNLTLDHLDYHKTMDQYAAAKAKLFTFHSKTAVINGDSPWSQSVIKDFKGPVLTYGINQPADLMAADIVLTSKEMEFSVVYQGKKYPFSCGLIGRFNIYNCLAAIGVGIMCKESIEKILNILRTFKNVPGRLERVPNKAGLNIFVDYAHTDDALNNVLETLSEIKKNRIITVFGCGGDRDRSKRPKMGAVAERFSDVTIVTSDNPRGEEPESIIQEILKGIQDNKKTIVEVDRAEAIHRAIKMAKPDDIILIAGKGHETYQIFAHETIEFDDRKIAQEAVYKK